MRKEYLIAIAGGALLFLLGLVIGISAGGPDTDEIEKAVADRIDAATAARPTGSGRSRRASRRSAAASTGSAGTSTPGRRRSATWAPSSATRSRPRPVAGRGDRDLEEREPRRPRERPRRASRPDRRGPAARPRRRRRRPRPRRRPSRAGPVRHLRRRDGGSFGRRAPRLRHARRRRGGLGAPHGQRHRPDPVGRPVPDAQRPGRGLQGRRSTRSTAATPPSRAPAATRCRRRPGRPRARSWTSPRGCGSSSPA